MISKKDPFNGPVIVTRVMEKGLTVWIFFSVVAREKCPSFSEMCASVGREKFELIVRFTMRLSNAELWIFRRSLVFSSYNDVRITSESE